ncbi:probable beta-hexosaminidase fdl [Leptidea sinapis]|uniref:probable beta-hexosaminidase fdl n=1 Tax=Leptidea sinapis TaxID=189913 RepID=UPI00212018F9|nr:probable beta-hexosaminidase fdl [Leptidea sinapis]
MQLYIYIKVPEISKLKVIRGYLLMFTIIYQVPGLLQNKVPIWSWHCVHEKCVPVKATMKEKMQSLTTCNLLCGSVYLWPQPTGHVSLSTSAVPVRSDLFQLNIISTSSRSVREHIEEAFDNFKDVLKGMEYKVRTFDEWRAVYIKVGMNENANSDPRLRLDTDESYKLSVKPDNTSSSTLIAEILANSFCGVRHALETLSQLIWLDVYAGSLIMLEAALVEDAPRFKYRGLMLDTARNYFPITDLIRTIDAMSACKLNTFHWHITDSQAFPLLVSGINQLSFYGTYSSSVVYTPDDVRAVAQYARVRGIRVLLEVDVPAHVGSGWYWVNSSVDNNLVFCLDATPWSAYCKYPPCGQLNPRSADVFDILQSLYSEIIKLTGVDDIFHLGNDDVSLRCWADHFDTINPMKLWFEFNINALKRLQLANVQLPNLIILWYSHLSESLRVGLKEFVPKIGLQTREFSGTQKYAKGLKIIVSHEDMWDLNGGHGNWYDESGGALYNSWQKVYEHRPWARKNIQNMLGGEATVWSPTLGSGGLDARVWPRAAALAERLWSDRPEGATRSVQARLDVQRTRLIKRGVQVAPLWSLWCTHNPYTC